MVVISAPKTREEKMAIDPSTGFAQLMKSWTRAWDVGVLATGQGFWHAGNTLDTCVTYLAQAKQNDTDNIVSRSYTILFDLLAGTPESPGWWRDDYGWWGIAFLNAAANAQTLGLSEQTKQYCINGADRCWQIMNTDWKNNNHNGVRNNPGTNPTPETNTITNVLFLMLSLRRYQMSGNTDQDALTAATGVFDWFYNAMPPPWEPVTGLFNSKNLIRYYPSHTTSDRAWTADQGWFWRACLDLDAVNSDPGRKENIETVMTRLGYAVLNTVFSDGIVSELPFIENYDINFATGIGVFMRQFAIISANKGSPEEFASKIRASAQGAWDNSDWQKDFILSGCWHGGASEYADQEAPAFALWDLTLKTSAQDAFNAYMTVAHNTRQAPPELR